MRVLYETRTLQPFSTMKTWATVFHYSHKHLAALLTWTMVLWIRAVWTCTHAHKYSTCTHKHRPGCLTVRIEFHYCSMWEPAEICSQGHECSSAAQLPAYFVRFNIQPLEPEAFIVYSHPSNHAPSFFFQTCWEGRQFMHGNTPIRDTRRWGLFRILQRGHSVIAPFTFRSGWNMHGFNILAWHSFTFKHLVHESRSSWRRLECSDP